MTQSSVRVPEFTTAGREVDCETIVVGGVTYYRQKVSVADTVGLTDTQLRTTPVTVHADISDDHLDAFGRLRVSQLQTMLDVQNHYGQLHQNFVSVIVAGGTLTDSPVNSSLTLAVDTTSGASVINRSRRSYYVAGQSHLVALTGNFGINAPVALVLRTSTSGTPSDARRIEQADWNIDAMGIAGKPNPSGITVDWSKTQIIMYDLQWLGVGRVRCFLDIDGKQYQIHQFLNANALTEVYMQTPHLPCSYEIANVGGTQIRKRIGYNDNDDGVFIEQLTTATSGSMSQICSAVFTEGATPVAQVKCSISNDVTGITCANNVLKHILSIRPAALFKTRTNKGMCVPLSIEIFVEGANNAHYIVIEDAVLTTPTWTAHPNVNSMMETCVGAAAAGITSVGHNRSEGYVTSGNKGGAGAENPDKSYRMQIDPANAPDVLTVAAEGMGGNSVVYAVITWEEMY